MRRLVMALAALVLILAACGDTDGDGDQDLDPLAAAQQRVTRAEADVKDAQGAFDSASDEFCADATDYVSAVDRYGHAFNDAAATVGDITTAGADLAEPQGDAVDSAEAAGDAREDLVKAEEELAQAKAALAELQTSTSASQGDSSTTEPVVPAASVDRIKAAQDDLDAAFEGVSRETALVDAGEQVNAAAFALEAAWLRVLEQGGCLSDEQEAQAVAQLAAYTSALQASLTATGHYSGPVDGVYGPGTVEAVKELQTESDLPVTGFVDRATATALSDAVAATGSDAEVQSIAHTAALQSLLALGGYWTGPIDGQWSDALTAALKDAQTKLGVPASGVVDAATLAAIEAAIAEAKTPPTTTTTESADAGGDTTTTTAP